jgi:hypothetical protein
VSGPTKGRKQRSPKKPVSMLNNGELAALVEQIKLRHPDRQQLAEELKRNEEERLLARKDPAGGPWPERPERRHSISFEGYEYVHEEDALPPKHPFLVEMARRDGMIRYAWRTKVYDASEPDEWEETRAMIEQATLYKYTHGVSGDELEEAVHHWLVDLLDMGHYPSRHMLRMISGELQRLYWPDRGSHKQQAQRSKEQAKLYVERLEIDHLAATKYQSVRNARTRAEQDVAEAEGLNVSGLRKRRDRYRKRIKKSTDELWLRRSLYPKR